MRIHYLFDPLCGWCYGAIPALRKLAQLGGVDVHLSPSGLFAGETARTMDAGCAAYAWQNDQRIARLTGQVFSEHYRADVLGAAGSLFDSAPATLGVVAAGASAKEHELKALIALQTARYADGRDNSNRAIVADVLSELGLEDAARRVLSPDEDLLNDYGTRVEAARLMMRQIGAQGVPAVVLEEGGAYATLPSSLLYGEFDALASHLRAA